MVKKKKKKAITSKEDLLPFERKNFETRSKDISNFSKYVSFDCDISLLSNGLNFNLQPNLLTM